MKTVREYPRLTPIKLIKDEVAKELNFALRITATEERTSVKYIVLDALRKRNPELSELIDQEIGE